MQTLMGRLLVLGGALHVGCAGTPEPDRSTLPPAAEPPAVEARECQRSEQDGHERTLFTELGLPLHRDANSDAAAMQTEERWERDAEGRVLRFHWEVFEGPTGPVTVRYEAAYREGPDDTVEVRYTPGSDSESEVVQRFSYDARNLPVRIETVRDGRPAVATCAYDELGRVTERNGTRFVYEGTAPFPAETVDSESGQSPAWTVPYTPLTLPTIHPV